MLALASLSLLLSDLALQFVQNPIDGILSLSLYGFNQQFRRIVYKMIRRNTQQKMIRFVETVRDRSPSFLSGIIPD